MAASGMKDHALVRPIFVAPIVCGIVGWLHSSRRFPRRRPMEFVAAPVSFDTSGEASQFGAMDNIVLPQSAEAADYVIIAIVDVQ